MALAALMLAAAVAVVMVWLSWHLDAVARDLHARIDDLTDQINNPTDQEENHS
jgi:type VI protein secretion system component VasF